MVVSAEGDQVASSGAVTFYFHEPKVDLTKC
jgi:hypothetical protein